MDLLKTKISSTYIDHYSHVGHDKYQVLIEKAQYKFLQRRVASFREMEKTYGLRHVQRAFHIEYIQPLYLNDKIIIETEINTRGDTSFTFIQQIKKKDVIVTKCETVYVAVDYNNCKVLMPAELKKKLMLKI